MAPGPRKKNWYKDYSLKNILLNFRSVVKNDILWAVIKTLNCFLLFFGDFDNKGLDLHGPKLDNKILHPVPFHVSRQVGDPVGLLVKVQPVHLVQPSVGSQGSLLAG